MTEQDLKNSILQLAIQGKLVEQREEEGTATELIEQIKNEKEQLIKEKKLKREKLLAEITEDEIPFEIPDSWQWIKLGDIGMASIGLTYKPENISSKGTIVLRSSNIQNGKLSYDDIVKVEMDISENKMCKKGDILICARNGSKRLVGKSAIINEENMSFGAFMALYRSICNEYIIYIINSAYFRNTLLSETATTTINQITQVMLRNFLIPLPPLKEQKRIVSKIEELMPYVENYGKAYCKMEQFNKQFPDDMNKSILQYAIQGKLVDQREEEGTAEELYEKIQEEKMRLIKEGKIKKEKPLLEITEEEKPFEIPESWKWVRLRNVVYDRGNIIPNDTFSYIDIGSINNKEQKLNNIDNIVEANKASSRARKIVDYGDILYSTVRPYLHNICIVDRNFTYQPIASTGFAVMTCYEQLYNKFLFYYLLSPAFDSYANSNENSKGVTYPAINNERLYKALVPLPPLQEQKRIVDKIEEMLPYIKTLGNI